MGAGSLSGHSRGSRKKSKTECYNSTLPSTTGTQAFSPNPKNGMSTGGIKYWVL